MLKLLNKNTFQIHCANSPGIDLSCHIEVIWNLYYHIRKVCNLPLRIRNGMGYTCHSVVQLHQAYNDTGQSADRK